MLSKIDEILDTLQKYEFVDVDEYGNEQVWVKRKQEQSIDLSTAKQQLLELLDSCKPKEKNDNYVTGAVLHDETIGYNKALNEYHSNIRKLFDDER